MIINKWLITLLLLGGFGFGLLVASCQHKPAPITPQVTEVIPKAAVEPKPVAVPKSNVPTKKKKVKKHKPAKATKADKKRDTDWYYRNTARQS